MKRLGDSGVGHNTSADEATNGQSLTADVEGSAIVSCDVDLPTAREVTLSGKTNRSFVDRKGAQTGAEGSHHVASPPTNHEETGAGLGEVGGGEVATQGGDAGLAVADINESFNGRARRTEDQVTVDDRSGGSVEDEAAAEEWRAVPSVSVMSAVVRRLSTVFGPTAPMAVLAVTTPRLVAWAPVRLLALWVAVFKWKPVPPT